MNGSSQKPTATTIVAVAALLISLAGVLWNAAVLSNQVAVSRERIVILEKEMIAERERRDARTQQLATIEVKIDLLLKEKDRR